MNTQNLFKIFSDLKCGKVYFKKLSANDNSKNQVYFGGSFDVLNILPIQEITADGDNKGGGKKNRFKTKIDFYWLNSEQKALKAPDAQLILYPKYPEVRFSGFLKGCHGAPSNLMTQRTPNRILFLGISSTGQVIGYVTEPESELSNEISFLKDLGQVGVFQSITLVGERIELNSKGKLLNELKRINHLGWIDSKRFDSSRNILPCNSSNCGGYTLEAELGITPNGYSEPDYLGWEIKQFSVTDFKKFGVTPITLMTPEPTHRFYVDEGVEKFITTYGYQDKMGREHRMNFGGIHKFGKVQDSTKLELVLDGYDVAGEKIVDTDGYLGLVDPSGNIAASWSFAALLKHWNVKHANSCYVPSKTRKTDHDEYKQQYSYGNLIMLGTNTDFTLFLKQVAIGNIYYDPGIKLEFAIENIRKQAIKRRSQFRMKSAFLSNLYKQNELIDLSSV